MTFSECQGSSSDSRIGDEVVQYSTGRDDIVSRALAELGYDIKWLLYSFVDEPFLQGQITQLRTGDDSNAEHYRYAAFLKVLAGQVALDDVSLARYVELTTLDHDQVMAKSALIRLVRWPGLTNSQRA